MAVESGSFVPLYAAVISVVGSFVGAWFATKMSKDSDRHHEARQLAKTFKGELSSIINVLHERDYQKEFRKAAAKNREDQKLFIYAVSVKQEYRFIYKANAAKIGCLVEPLPEIIATVYTMMAALLEEFESLSDMLYGNKSWNFLGSPDQAGDRFDGLASAMDALVADIRATVTEIDKHYPS